jgi:hypothetical protein
MPDDIAFLTPETRKDLLGRCKIIGAVKFAVSGLFFLDAMSEKGLRRDMPQVQSRQSREAQRDVNKV